MDYSFTLVPVTMLFLNHSGTVTIRLTLLDNRAVAISIPIPIMAFANCHANTHGTSSNSNFVCQSWRRNGSYGSNNQSVLHIVFPPSPLNLIEPVVESSSKFAKEPFSVGCLRGNADLGYSRDPVVAGYRVPRLR
jgi:hypothetical protein